MQRYEAFGAVGGQIELESLGVGNNFIQFSVQDQQGSVNPADPVQGVVVTSYQPANQR